MTLLHQDERGEWLKPARRGIMMIDRPGDIDATEAYLENDGFDVVKVRDGEAALDSVEAVSPIAIILGLDLPGIDGFETCRLLRSRTTANLIILTDRTDEMAKIAGFATGADDYLTKPVPSWEIAARLRAVIRRQYSPRTDKHLSCGPIDIDLRGRNVLVSDCQVVLTRIEFELLVALAERAEQVVTRVDLITAIWGPDWIGSPQLLQVHVSNLRRKLSAAGAGNAIHSSIKVGYKLKAAANR